MDLTEEFQKFVGLIVKDPQRVTCDTDPEADKITTLARQHSLMVDWVKMDNPADNEPFMFDVNAVHVAITKEGVPEDKPWGFRVAHLTVEN